MVTLAPCPASFLEALRARALLVLLLCGLAVPGSAWAHATLVKVVPESGAVLAKPPKAVRFVFDDDVRLGSGIKAIRNVGLFGHQGVGKTSLAEALLFTSGALDRLGRTDDGTATTDFDPEGWLSRDTLIGLITSQAGPGTMGILRLSDPAHPEDWHFSGTFVDLLAPAR